MMTNATSPSATHFTASPMKASKTSTVKGPGAVKITLHSANQEIDEKAEVTVALHNPEDAVEKMLQTLAQRFPPESVMTIAPAKGVDSSNSSSRVQDGSGSATGSQFSSSSDRGMSSQRQDRMEEGRLMGVNNPELIRSSMQSGAYVALSPEIRQGMASLPSEYTSWILSNDPALLPELLNFATRSGDTKSWATQLDLDPDAVSTIVNALRADPIFYNWVSKLASAALSPTQSRSKALQRKRRSKRTSRSVPSAVDGKKVGLSPAHGSSGAYMQAPGLRSYSPVPYGHYGMPPFMPPLPLNMQISGSAGGHRGSELYQAGYPIYHMTHGQSNAANTHPMPAYHHQSSPMYHGFPHQTFNPQGNAVGNLPHADRTSLGADVHPSAGSMLHSQISIDGHHQNPETQTYAFDHAGPGETIEVLRDGTRVRYVETPVVEERIIEVPRKEIVEIPKTVTKPVIQEVEKVVEVPEIQYVERSVEVEKVEEVIRHVKRKEYVDVPVTRIKEVKVPQTKIVEKVVTIPNIIERPKIYTVEQKVPIARYVNQETQTVVAQKLRPIVKEGKKHRIRARKFEPVLYAVDVPIPKPVACGFMPLGKVDEWHSTVEIPAPQYNSLLQTMNRNIDAQAIEDLFVRTSGGYIPLLPAGELTEVVSPIPSAFAQAARGDRTHRHKKSTRRTTRKHRSASPTRKPRHRYHH